MRPLRVFAWSFLVVCIGHRLEGQAIDPEKTASPIRVRFDAVHSHTWVESVPRPGINQYHLLASPSRAAQALVAMGCQVDVQLKSWDPESLSDIDLVVLNLVSADRPAFLVSEIDAIRGYVHRGGGLILITDHTNCYFHNHVLEPLCQQLDLKLTNQTACERPPRTLAAGSGWILVESFGKHPIVRGVEYLGVQTGGTVDDRFGIAFTSPESWGDAGQVPMYGEGKDMGFSGNFHQDPGEPSGPLAIAAARSFGEGRVVVIGDQNSIGGFFLNYADNRRFWLQSALWAAGSPSDSESRLSKGMAAEPDRTLVWCVEPLTDRDFYWGSTDQQEYYHAFGLLCKHADARASDRDLMQADWMMIPHHQLMQQARWQAKTREFLTGPDKHAVVFLNEGQQTEVEWVQGILEGKKYTLSESDSSRIYTIENRSTLQLWKQAKRWSNRQLLGPDVTRNDADYRWEEALLSPLWQRGFKRVQSFEELVNWPEE